MYSLIRGPEEDLFEWCVAVGFLADRRLSPCPKCGKVDLSVVVPRGGA